MKIRRKIETTFFLLLQSLRAHQSRERGSIGGRKRCRSTSLRCFLYGREPSHRRIDSEEIEFLNKRGDALAGIVPEEGRGVVEDRSEINGVTYEKEEKKEKKKKSRRNESRKEANPTTTRRLLISSSLLFTSPFPRPKLSNSKFEPKRPPSRSYISRTTTSTTTSNSPNSPILPRRVRVNASCSDFVPKMIFFGFPVCRRMKSRPAGWVGCWRMEVRMGKTELRREEVRGKGRSSRSRGR